MQQQAGIHQPFNLAGMLCLYQHHLLNYNTRRCLIATVATLLAIIPLSLSLPPLRHTNIDTSVENSLKIMASSNTISDEKICNKDNKEGTSIIRDIILKESRGYDINDPTNVPKRSNYLSWDDYFLAVAYLSAQRSKDPHPVRNSRNGACIVDAMGRIVGIVSRSKYWSFSRFAQTLTILFYPGI